MQDKPLAFLQSQNNLLEARKPAFCCIGVSTGCMLRCRMCAVWKKPYVKTHEEPSLDEWYRFIDAAAVLTDNNIEINVAGGEPLLDERNLALIRYSAKRGLLTSLPTNGYLIDEEMAQKIAESGLHAIGISLDGMRKETHDFLRGVEGCYDRVMQAIRYLHMSGRNLGIGILTTLSAINIPEIIDLVEQVNEDTRIETIIFQAVAQPFNTPFDGGWHSKDEFRSLWPQDIDMAGKVIDELIRLKMKGYKISNSVSQLEVFKRYFAWPHTFVKTGKCNVDFYMNINEYGDVYMCTRKKAIGNIKRDAPKDAWFSGEAGCRREEIRNCRINCHHLLNCCYEKE